MADILDIMIYESGDGGEINLINDDIDTIKGLTNQVYLALFGGNVEESTSENSNIGQQRLDWPGNEYMETENQFNSSFERKLNEINLTSAGISILLDTAKKDIDFLNDYADIEIEGNIIGLGKFQLDVKLQEPGQKSTKLIFIWDNTKNEVVQNITI